MSLRTALSKYDLDLDMLIKKKKVEEREYDGIKYIRFVDDVQGILEGTVIFENGTVVPGYPHIRRVYNLRMFILRRFSEEPFVVEEKIDGYNVRIIKIDDVILAVTRGGIVCPYTTEIIQDMECINRFFEENKGLALVGEMAGPENPYIDEHPEYIKKGVRFFLFDIVRTEPRCNFLPIPTRNDLATKYRIPLVPVLGLFTHKDIDIVEKIVETLDREGKEGIVIKDVNRTGNAYKYVTISADIKDLELGSPELLALEEGYFIQRIFRIAFALALGKGNEAYVAERVGRALIIPLVRAIKRAISGETIGKTFTVTVKKLETFEKLMHHFDRMGVDIEIKDIERTREGYWRITFKKVHRGMTDRIRFYYNGGTTID